MDHLKGATRGISRLGLRGWIFTLAVTLGGARGTSTRLQGRLCGLGFRGLGFGVDYFMPHPRVLR